VESGGKDARPLVKRVYDAFGADRMIWGGLGANLNEFEKAAELFDTMFAFAPEPERAKIRGLTAWKLYAFVR
jgi:predicted TIM-barrel fold metal-dependent hydrolase